VSDIIERAGMTPGAFYYHFSSREQLLKEVVGGFADDWVTTIETLLEAAQTPQDLQLVPEQLLDRIDAAPQAARIYFLNDASAPALVEQVHGEARARLMRAATTAIRRLAPERDLVTAKVNGVSMVVLYEMAARSHLMLDETYRTLGPRRFREELARLSAVTSGIA
jgi:AcrR family transcriptional regulator